MRKCLLGSEELGLYKNTEETDLRLELRCSKYIPLRSWRNSAIFSSDKRETGQIMTKLFVKAWIGIRTMDLMIYYGQKN